MYRSGGEQARAEAQQKRKQEREGIRTDFLSSSEPPNTWQQAKPRASRAGDGTLGVHQHQSGLPA